MGETRIKHVDTPRTLEIGLHETKPPAIYLATVIADGTTANGDKLELLISGATLIVNVGPFSTGKQFKVNLINLVGNLFASIANEEALTKEPTGEVVSNG